MRRIALGLSCLTFLALVAAPARADIKPHALFADGMVLQQGMPCPVWGTAEAGEKVAVTLLTDGKEAAKATATADQGGKWMVKLPPQKAGTGHSLVLEGKNKVTIKDVLVGEVWICSGQSNMEWPLRASEGGAAAIEKSANPQIRLFTVPHTSTDTLQTDVKGQWSECGPKTVPGFSGVAYFFGRDLQAALKVPVGLIHNSWGGQPAEAYTSMAALDAHPEHKGKAGNQAKLYNGMVAPLIPYAIKGAIWYQGESNAGRAELYRTLFPLMIKNWRDDWKQGDFPFLFVQLAPFKAINKEPADTDWAHLRDAQRHTSLTVPNTAMAVIIDGGDEKDIHPKRKEPAGARLALAARALAYGDKVEYEGPSYDKMKVEGGKAILSFKHVGRGLEAKGGETLTGFTIAGEDKKFVNAKAEIQGDMVLVWSDEVKAPVAVRYGWADYPVVNLWNKDGLPASPFRTDNSPQVKGAPKPGK
jgi:sialate O-acetylesterase